MHRLFGPVIAPLLEALEPRAILETGSGSGRLTRRLLDAPGAEGALLHAVDPAPRLSPDLLDTAAERLRLHPERAINAIGRIGAVDLALLDGDPNRYTVHAELTMLEWVAAQAGRPAPLAVVHGVHWPFGRRDGYYDPEAIPAAQRMEYSDMGLLPGRREPSPDGLRLTPYCADKDFELQSGVLTGVEEAVGDSELRWTLIEVPGFHGVAVLAEARLLSQRPAVSALLDELRSPRFLGRQVRRAESARLAVEVALVASGGVAPVEAASEPEESLEPESPVAEVQVYEPVEVAEEPAAAEAGSSLAGELESEHASLLAELAEQRARREAAEWRLERLDEDLAARTARLDALTAAGDDERKAAIESQVRLESATAELADEREAAKELRRRLSELEEEADARTRELAEVVEREQLAQGRLAHREDALQAAKADSERLRAELDGLAAELRLTRERLDEIVAHLDRAGSSRRARLGRKLAAIGRTVTFRRELPPSPIEAARAAAERALPAQIPSTGEGDPREEAQDRLEAGR